ncbi:MAG TPA: hypothetical protein IAC04_02880 [Candidatus Coprenecus stercoravium]|uniref:Uncharacterized protein n=1 Tax=Candidatus Coprenecus stercoravium TaxID=2840735 RepID=A0A9D2K9P4_9BACT|nr:hypothetical protein [Candidatus Coprenecus stercoravium]
MKIIRISLKVLASLLLVIITGLAVLSVSPIYEFTGPVPFSGERIYNPYSDFDSVTGWKRACLHTHTKVDKGINECPYYPDVVYSDYMSYGYDILGLTNHQALTPHPVDSCLYIAVYEHGYNLFKFHLNPYGVNKVEKFDHILPILLSQKQFMIDRLAADGDFVQFNHPNRTLTINRRVMEHLSGYRLVEGDSGFEERDHGSGTSLDHWDEALSAGRYAHNIINDDNHNSKAHAAIARRCSWINTPTPYYEDIREQLLKGNFYSMRVPDFGDGDTSVKHMENLRLPAIKDIGMRSDTVYMRLSAPAAAIRVISQNGIAVDSAFNSTDIQYVMKASDPYVRMTAWYDNGVTIYTNAFARFSEGDSPYRDFPHPVRWGMTILWNLMLLAIAAACVYGIYSLYKHL